MVCQISTCSKKLSTLHWLVEEIIFQSLDGDSLRTVSVLMLYLREQEKKKSDFWLIQFLKDRF